MAQRGNGAMVFSHDSLPLGRIGSAMARSREGRNMGMARRMVVAAAAVALVVAAVACQERTLPPTATPMTSAPTSETTPPCPPDCAAFVTGTLDYRERAALPPDAVASVRLEDVSLADAPSVLIAERVIANPGQVPIRFEIGYDPALIDERRDYAVQATITRGGELLFANDTVYSVLTWGNPSEVEMVLARVGR